MWGVASLEAGYPYHMKNEKRKTASPSGPKKGRGFGENQHQRNWGGKTEVRAINRHALLNYSIILRARASTEKEGGGLIEVALPRRWLEVAGHASPDGRRSKTALNVDDIVLKLRCPERETSAQHRRRRCREQGGVGADTHEHKPGIEGCKSTGTSGRGGGASVWEAREAGSRDIV